MAFPTGWAYYEVITLPAVSGMSVDAVLSNFPFPITNLSAAVYANARSDGGDIRFTTADGVTEIPVEIVSFDAVGNTAEIWIKAPTVSQATTNDVRVYYGAPSETMPPANSTYGSQNVWDANFKGVYHLGEAVNNVADGYKDSTANANHMTGYSMSIAASVGKIGYAQNFDGVSSYLERLTPLVTAAPLTFSAWSLVHLAGLGAIVATTATDGGESFLLYTDTDNIYRYLTRAVDISTSAVCSSAFTIDTWHHVAGKSEAANSRSVLMDGANKGLDTVSKVPGAMDSTHIGRWSSADSYPFNGSIDEVRISNIARSDDWLYAEYWTAANQTAITPGRVSLLSGLLTRRKLVA